MVIRVTIDDYDGDDEEEDDADCNGNARHTTARVISLHGIHTQKVTEIYADDNGDDGTLFPRGEENVQAQRLTDMFTIAVTVLIVQMRGLVTK